MGDITYNSRICLNKMVEDWQQYSKEELGTVAEYKQAMGRSHVDCPDVDEELNQFMNSRMHATEPVHRRKTVTIWLLAAASVAALVVFSVGLYRSLNPENKDLLLYSAIDNASDLSLDVDGDTYVLNGSNADDAQKDLGVVVKGDNMDFAHTSASAPQGMRTLTTPCGKIYQVRLPDGSKIRLNAGSVLRFPAVFAHGERRVYLKGEAFFDVKHDARHPFIVETDYFQTKVLGTKFDIKAYDKRNANVALVEGRIEVKNGKSPSRLLMPDEGVSLQANGKLKKQKVDSYLCSEWQNGTFYFDDATLSEIMQEIGRWYNVDVIVSNKRVMNERFHFVAERKENLVQAISNLNELGKANIIIHNNKVIIK